VEGEEVLISRGKELGLADVDAVRQAIERGWTVAALGDLFDEFERRRPTWDREIKSPCGLLRTWLRTLEPDAPIPWPASVKPVRRRATAKEAAQKRINQLFNSVRAWCTSNNKSWPQEGIPRFLEEVNAAGLDEAEARKLVQ
jgi:hypothetical protein